MDSLVVLLVCRKRKRPILSSSSSASASSSSSDSGDTLDDDDSDSPDSDDGGQNEADVEDNDLELPRTPTFDDSSFELLEPLPQRRSRVSEERLSGPELEKWFLSFF